MPKALKITKTILYIATGTLIFVFFWKMLPYAAFLVGGVVLIYALEELVFCILRRQFAALAESLIQIILAVLLFFSNGDLAKVCVIWGVWGIIRESRELTHALVNIKKRRLAIWDIIESVVVISLSVTMILSPNEHHATVHLVLLGIELILEVTFPWLEELLAVRKTKPDKSAKQ
ncbi:MAG: hypothetical protein E7680_03740 [Ruminococcaceae bacterium]|nr:hypothetical protein [Oscillospiraceae bacterium]